MQFTRPLLCSLAAVAIVCAAHANLIANGGFETGDFTDWSLSGNTGFTGVSGNFEGINPYDGNYQGYFGAVGSLGFLDQTIATTAGQTYTLSFWLANEGGTPSEWSVSAGGNTLADVPNPGGFGYTEFFDSFTATGSTTDIGFGFRQDPAYFLLDDVSVVPGGSVPDATTSVALLGLGLGGLFLVRRRQASAAA
jgi:hypothetical protein